MRILMVAAENGALPGGKVGGMGDVLAQVPPVLAARGHEVHVLLPSYGVYQDLPGSELATTVAVAFAGVEQRLRLYRLPAMEGVHVWVLDHAVFADPAGKIYHHDGAGAPFATDANLYALFCCGAAAALAQAAWGELDVLHLHDWHAAGVLLFPEALTSSGMPRTVFTIHNLAVQGQRPLAGHPSSFADWFGGMACPAGAIDPRYPDCYNPMRLGITCADRVHVVSPGYAQEVVRPNGPFLHGGEGLDADLRAAADAGRLHGILNGCEYPETPPERPTRTAIWQRIEDTLAGWITDEGSLSSAHFFASRNLDRLRARRRERMLLTSVGRLVDQKVGLLRLRSPEGGSMLDSLLHALRKKAVLVVLGSGDPACEAFFTEAAGRHANLIYLRGFSEVLASDLYNGGDLFLMPSVFEPCGISQMLAMRGGQPCLVHAVGGLADTVHDEDNGFSFRGDSASQAARAFLMRLADAVALWNGDDNAWRTLSERAAESRFTWSKAAADYERLLYG
ncbi:MAG: glycogen/starch synthase [Pseudomonadales bacterium]